VLLKETNASSDSSTQNTSRMSIITASRKSCIHIVNQDEDGWASREVKLTHQDPERGPRGIHSLIPIPSLSLYLVGRSHAVDLVDLESSCIIFTLRTEAMKQGSLRHIAPVRVQHNGLASLTLAYVDADTDDLIVRTYLPEDETGVIYSYNPVDAKNGHRQSWAAEREVTRRVRRPGAWEALSNGSIVGVRRRPTANGTKKQPQATMSIFQRLGVGQNDTKPSSRGQDEAWEAWVISHLETTGDIEERLLDEHPGERSSRTRGHVPSQLMISELGPMAKFGTTSVAVGFGNVVKVISVGHEHFDNTQDRFRSGGDMRSMMIRRRKTAGLTKIRASY